MINVFSRYDQKVYQIANEVYHVARGLQIERNHGGSINATKLNCYETFFTVIAKTLGIDEKELEDRIIDIRFLSRSTLDSVLRSEGNPSLKSCKLVVSEAGIYFTTLPEKIEESPIEKHQKPKK